MNNADRFRAMDDEQLALFFKELMFNDFKPACKKSTFFSAERKPECEEDCVSCILKLLQQPAERGGHVIGYDKLTKHLKRRGLNNGCALGPHSGLYEEAATAIKTLHADLIRVIVERDAAVKDLKKWSICATCKHYNPHGKKSHCTIKKAYLPGGNWAGCSKWEWQGVEKEER